MFENLKQAARTILRRNSAPAPEPEYEVFLIPIEHCEKFAKLYDAATLIDPEGRAPKLRLWMFISAALPQCTGTGWSIVWLSHTEPAIRRIKPAAPCSP